MLILRILSHIIQQLKGFQKKQLLKLSEIFELDTDFSVQKFSKKTLLKKNITNEEILLLKKLKLSSIEVESRHSRHYPLGDQISPLIGFYGKDGAQEGLEKSYDNVLSGLAGRQKYFKNAKQELISQPIELVKLKHGSDVH